MTAMSMIKIAVADTSVIIRMGVIGALKRVWGSEVSLLEVAHPDDFDNRMASFVPSVVIVSPTFGGVFDADAQRRKSGLFARGCRFVALLSAVVPQTAMRGFDACLTIFDDEDSLLASVQKLSGKASREPEAAEGAEGDGETLSAREKQVVRGVVSGLANKEIADQMNISVYTVLTHRRNISRKLNIHSSIALAIYAISNKLVSVDDVK